MYYIGERRNKGEKNQLLQQIKKRHLHNYSLLKYLKAQGRKLSSTLFGHITTLVENIYQKKDTDMF